MSKLCHIFEQEHGKNLVYFCEVSLFSDRTKAKHIFKFSNSFIKEERKNYFS